MDALSRVTKYVRGVYDVFQQPLDYTLGDSPPLAKEKDAGFEDLGQASSPKVDIPVEVEAKVLPRPPKPFPKLLVSFFSGDVQ